MQSQRMLAPINSHLSVLSNYLFAPDYARCLHDSGEVQPAYGAGCSYTTPENGFVCLSAWKEKGGYTLFVKVNGINLYKVPAYGTPACTISFPVFASQTITISTDISSASWTCVLKVFGCATH